MNIKKQAKKAFSGQSLKRTTQLSFLLQTICLITTIINFVYDQRDRVIEMPEPMATISVLLLISLTATAFSFTIRDKSNFAKPALFFSSIISIHFSKLALLGGSPTISSLLPKTNNQSIVMSCWHYVTTPSLVEPHYPTISAITMDVSIASVMIAMLVFIISKQLR